MVALQADEAVSDAQSQALDAAGEPMPSYYVVNFRFQLFSAPAGSASALR